MGISQRRKCILSFVCRRGNYSCQCRRCIVSLPVSAGGVSCHYLSVWGVYRVTTCQCGECILSLPVSVGSVSVVTVPLLSVRAAVVITDCPVYCHYSHRQVTVLQCVPSVCDSLSVIQTRLFKLVRKTNRIE